MLLIVLLTFTSMIGLEFISKALYEEFSETLTNFAILAAIPVVVYADHQAKPEEKRTPY